MSDAVVNKTRTEHPQPGIGHNRPSLADAAEANVRSGVLLLCKEALITAIQDRRLHRDHLRVLAAIAMCVNAQTAKAWPSREAISSLSGLSVRAVANALVELRKWDYLISDRETVEAANNRRLTVYTFGNIDHEEIRRQITSICLELQKLRPTTEGKSPQEVTSQTSPQEVTVTPGGDELDENVTSEGDNGTETSPQEVRSNSKNNNIPLIPSKPSPKGKPKTKLPEDWKPAQQTITWAKENFVVTDQQVADQAEKFHAYHFGKGSKQADWPATWRTWWLNGYHKHPRRRKSASADPTLPFGTATVDDRNAADEMTAAYERILAEEEAERCRR